MSSETVEVSKFTVKIIVGAAATLLGATIAWANYMTNNTIELKIEMAETKALVQNLSVQVNDNLKVIREINAMQARFQSMDSRIQTNKENITRIRNKLDIRE